MGEEFKMRRRWNKVLAYTLIITMWVSMINIPINARENTDSAIEIKNEVGVENTEVEKIVESDTEKVVIDENDGGLWDGITTENIYEGNDFKITYTLTSYWDTGYNANIKIENTGNYDIEDWRLKFKSQNKISNIWNAEILENTENEYSIKNIGWNQDIPKKECVEFGISGEDMFKGFPDDYELVSSISEVEENGYLIEYTVDSNWENGFTGNIRITNNTENTIEDWVLEFDFDRNITNIWNAVSQECNGSHYVIKNAGYNANIATGQTISFGFSGNDGEIEDEPKNYRLYSYADTEKYIDLDNNGIPDEFEDISKWGDMQDTDGDMLPDDVEKWLGSNENDSDTDHDGLSDYYEMFITYTDLLLADTDGDGILDGDEDLDNDGLVNSEEAFISHPLYSDTDGDGLSDYDERMIYMTDPNIKDTDKDGADDWWEINNNYDPLVYNEKFLLSGGADGTNIKATVSLDVPGSAVNSLVVEPVEDLYFLDDTIPGYIGSPFEFEVGCDFSAATLTFEFDSSYLDDEDFVPAIYHFDEENQVLEELDTMVEGNKATATTNHFSIYVLLNKTTYEKSWNEIKAPSGKSCNSVNIGFVLDSSYSMKGQKMRIAKRVISKYVDEIQNSDVKTKVSLVGMASAATIVSKLTDDYDTFVRQMYKVETRGQTQIYKGLNASLSILINNEERQSAHNVIILLTDGCDEPEVPEKVYTNIINKAKEYGIQIYTVGIGPVNEQLLIKIADGTGGKYYFATNSATLYDIYENIQTDIEDYTLDSNSDGISDYYSKLLCEGKLRIGTQCDLFENISYDEFNANDDYDGDGIINGKEFEIRLDKSTGRVYVYLWSNPFSKDTDNDGIEDPLDQCPMDGSRGIYIYKTRYTDEKLKSLSFEQRPEDFQYADKSIEQLRDMKYINWTDFFGLEVNDYVYSWKSLVKMASTGDMQDVALDMVNHFMDGTATDYWNLVLTKNIEEHSSSKKYISQISHIINGYIENNDGDISGLVYNENNRENSYMVSKMKNVVDEPVYDDAFSGLGICVDGLYGNEIELISYYFDGTNYEYTLKFTLYDIYGLDSADIEANKMVKKIVGFGLVGGFRSWYILQHCNLYGGDYQPYITYSSFEKTIRGTLQ